MNYDPPVSQVCESEPPYFAAALPTSSSAFSVVALIVGTSCTTFGAFIGAHRARTAFLIHGLLVAAVAFAISFARFLAFTLNAPSDPSAVHPLWWELVGWFLLAAAGVLGGLLAQRNATRPTA